MGANCADDQKFCDEYMILTPDEGGLWDMVKLLFSGDMEKNNLVKRPKGQSEDNLKRRFLLFLSVVVQKGLHAFSKPLAWFGATIEMWLNLLSHNQNFGRLLLNLVQGKLVIPERTWATFGSGLAHLDQRIELDKDIQLGDSRYYGAFSIMAAKLSYENEAFVQRVVTQIWKMEFLGFYNFWNGYQKKPTTQVFMLRNRTPETDIVVVAFRGTETFDSDAWSTDFDLSWYNIRSQDDRDENGELKTIGKVHGGFMKALGLHEKLGWPKELEQEEGRPQVAYYGIREKLREISKENHQAKFIITGHSLGGALAALFPVVLAVHGEGELLEKLEGVYTYGQPRVGDQQLGAFMTEKMRIHNVKYVRYVYGNDMVPRLPMDDNALMFKHFGTCMYYNSLYYQGQIVSEEPNKNYFSLLWLIPKIGNAFWELIRSFIIHMKLGSDYGEGWYLRIHRVIGLLIPGVPAHAPQDYVNATRRGILCPLSSDQLQASCSSSLSQLYQGPKSD